MVLLSIYKILINYHNISAEGLTYEKSRFPLLLGLRDIGHEFDDEPYMQNSFWEDIYIFKMLLW